MNPKSEWEDGLPMKKRQVSLRERIQQWKRQRQSILISDASQHSDSSSASTDVKPTELKLVQLLCDKAITLPVDVATLSAQVVQSSSDANVLDILTRLSAQKVLELTTAENAKTYVASVDYASLEALRERYETVSRSDGESAETSLLLGEDHQIKLESETTEERVIRPEDFADEKKDLVECILSLQSAKERENKKISEEILNLLSKPTAKELSVMEQFRSATGHVQEFCQHGTRDECKRVKQSEAPCPKLHFLKIIQKHTDESLGDCSFLNTCFHMESCKYVHYRVEVKERDARTDCGSGTSGANNDGDSETLNNIPLMKTLASATEQPFKRVLFPPQWIKCDLRYFDMSILGKFAIIMADPPWDIHMELPYGTMSDDEMRKLNIPCLQDEGIIFLWVTGRAMELGRECLKLWGYERCDELIWVKTNQLQRIIRTGRTGHWINHGKEHCLVGVKGSPKNLNRGLDCDVIVAEVRATSHKPDEIYGIIERLSPGTRKIELFGRQHNTQPNWVTLGNQLTGLKLVDPQLIESYKRLYPEDAVKFNL